MGSSRLFCIRVCLDFDTETPAGRRAARPGDASGFTPRLFWTAARVQKRPVGSGSRGEGPPRDDVTSDSAPPSGIKVISDPRVLNPSPCRIDGPTSG
ncbi:hypothetical protein EYF80_047746 [Liparis tanakae]|uniref:Uncharacterized protein n=1 Tax=Liparis tanakae TaxID=230148 RepID=A0A4Z2FLF0_9TELE|nr:hypothetical protein EYF80_047746 [Liparis tanakae]